VSTDYGGQLGSREAATENGMLIPALRGSITLDGSPQARKGNNILDASSWFQSADSQNYDLEVTEMQAAPT